MSKQKCNFPNAIFQWAILYVEMQKFLLSKKGMENAIFQWGFNLENREGRDLIFLLHLICISLPPFSRPHIPFLTLSYIYDTQQTHSHLHVQQHPGDSFCTKPPISMFTAFFFLHFFSFVFSVYPSISFTCGSTHNVHLFLFTSITQSHPGQVIST